MSGGFATIGHSSRPPEVVIGMLRDAGIQLLVDVRSYPRSRTHPAFNEDCFAEALAAHQIGYRHMRALGGRRGKHRGVDEQLNAFWQESAFHNYADYAIGPEFQGAFQELVREGCRQPLAIMCAEAVWWRCHRRIISDYLLLHGHAVRHLMAPGREEAAEPTAAAQLRADGSIIYPQA